MAFVLSPNTDEDFVVTSSLFLHSLELVITALFYNPALSLSILARHAWTSQFFTLWFKNLNKLTRVHDRKLSIGAICGVFEVLASGQNEGLEGAEVMLMAGTLGMFKAFPEALLGQSHMSLSLSHSRLLMKMGMQPRLRWNSRLRGEETRMKMMRSRRTKRRLRRRVSHTLSSFDCTY